MTRKLAIVLRVFLGAVFLYAAYTKLRESYLVFAMSIDAYQMAPDWAALWIARTLPTVELILGLLLVSGKFLRYAAPALSALLIGFYAAMLHVYHLGLGIDCGCFGVGEKVSMLTLTRDGVLLASSLLLTFLVFHRGSTTPQPNPPSTNNVCALT